MGKNCLVHQNYDVNADILFFTFEIARYWCELGIEAFHFTRAIAPIGAYTHPLSIYHSEIVARDTIQCRSYGTESHDEMLNTRLCGHIIMSSEYGMRMWALCMDHDNPFVFHLIQTGRKTHFLITFWWLFDTNLLTIATIKLILHSRII